MIQTYERRQHILEHMTVLAKENKNFRSMKGEHEIKGAWYLCVMCSLETKGIAETVLDLMLYRSALDCYRATVSVRLLSGRWKNEQ